MRKEFGKWLMDIAKYITTAVILSSVFGEIEPLHLYLGGGLAVLICLVIGLRLVSDSTYSVDSTDTNKSVKHNKKIK